MGEKVASLPPVIVRVEHKALLVEGLEENYPDGRLSAFLDRAEGHRADIRHQCSIDLLCHGVHGAESFDRVG